MCFDILHNSTFSWNPFVVCEWSLWFSDSTYEWFVGDSTVIRWLLFSGLVFLWARVFVFSVWLSVLAAALTRGASHLGVLLAVLHRVTMLAIFTTIRTITTGVSSSHIWIILSKPCTMSTHLAPLRWHSHMILLHIHWLLISRERHLLLRKLSILLWVETRCWVLTTHLALVKSLLLLVSVEGLASCLELRLHGRDQVLILLVIGVIHGLWWGWLKGVLGGCRRLRSWLWHLAASLHHIHILLLCLIWIGNLLLTWISLFKTHLITSILSLSSRLWHTSLTAIHIGLMLGWWWIKSRRISWKATLSELWWKCLDIHVQARSRCCWCCWIEFFCYI